MSPLQSILTTYRSQSQSEREKGTYFEELIRTYPTTTDAKRLAMEMAKRHDAQHMSVVFSTYDINNEAQFGKQLHVITISDAVQFKLPTDYKVIVLTIDEAQVSARIQDLLKDESNQCKVDAAARSPWKRPSLGQRRRQRLRFVGVGRHADLDAKNISNTLRPSAHRI